MQALLHSHVKHVLVTPGLLRAYKRSEGFARSRPFWLNLEKGYTSLSIHLFYFVLFFIMSSTHGFILVTNFYFNDQYLLYWDLITKC